MRILRGAAVLLAAGAMLVAAGVATRAEPAAAGSCSPRALPRRRRPRRRRPDRRDAHARRPRRPRGAIDTNERVTLPRRGRRRRRPAGPDVELRQRVPGYGPGGDRSSRWSRRSPRTGRSSSQLQPRSSASTSRRCCATGERATGQSPVRRRDRCARCQNLQPARRHRDARALRADVARPRVGAARDGQRSRRRPAPRASATSTSSRRTGGSRCGSAPGACATARCAALCKRSAIGFFRISRAIVARAAQLPRLRAHARCSSR